RPGRHSRTGRTAGAAARRGGAVDAARARGAGRRAPADRERRGRRRGRRVIARRLSDEEFQRAGALVGARCGLRFDDVNRAILEKGLWCAAESEGTTPGELLVRLKEAPTDALIQSVLRQVTIGETYLFRHPEHF